MTKAWQRLLPPNSNTVFYSIIPLFDTSQRASVAYIDMIIVLLSINEESNGATCLPVPTHPKPIQGISAQTLLEMDHD
jgi:hypothetical protein